MPVYAITIEAVTTILLGTRFVARFKRKNGVLGLDDLFIAIAWALATASIGLILLFSFKYGLDKHIWDLRPTLWEGGAELSWLIAVLFLWSTAFTKVSVLLFYRRLVAGTYSKRFKWLLLSAIAFILFYSVVIFIFMCSSCNPIEAAWAKYNLTNRRKYFCLSELITAGVLVTGGALSVLTDAYSVMLPAIFLLGIRVTSRQRIELIFIFGLGFLVVIAGIVRTIYLSRLERDGIDKTWLGFDVFVAGITEGNIGIVCACAPSLKAYFRTFFCDHMAGSSMTKRSTQITGHNTHNSIFVKGSQVPQLGTSWECDDKKRVMETCEVFDLEAISGPIRTGSNVSKHPLVFSQSGVNSKVRTGEP